MKTDELTSSKLPTENIVMVDECGDTLWDAVLAEAEAKEVIN